MGTSLSSQLFGLLLKQLEPLLVNILPWLYRPQFTASDWRVGFSVHGLARDIDLNAMKAREVLDVIVEDDLEADFQYYFEVDLLSHPGIGLRDLTVAFVFYRYTEEHQPHNPHTSAPLKRLNLPPRQLVTQEVTGTFRIRRDSAMRLQECKSVKFAGRLLTRTAFEWTVTEDPMEILVGSS